MRRPIGQMENNIFHYYKAWLKNGFSIDPINFPLLAKEFDIVSHPGVFGDLLPDSWGRGILSQIAPAGWDRYFPGYGGLRRPGNRHIPAIDNLHEIFDLCIQFEKGIKPKNLKSVQKFKNSFFMGGARPKCVIRNDNDLYICKFQSCDDSYDEISLEFAVSRLAKACEIKTPDMLIKEINGEKVLFSKRFDQDGKIFASAFSLSGLKENYQLDDPYNSYLNIMEILKKYGDPEDVEQLFRRIVFNVIVGNIDDHAKNTGFLISENGLVLSPAYDIVPALWDIGDRFYGSMEIGQFGTEFSIRNLLSMAKKFQLSENIIFIIINKVKVLWPKIFELSRVGRQECAAFAKIVNRKI